MHAFRCFMKCITGGLLLLTFGCRLTLAQTPTHDLSRDFSLSGNPNGAWSYGRQDTIGGAFIFLGTAMTANAENGVPNQLWVISPGTQPVIFHNDTAETATADGGLAIFPPETTWFGPGLQGQPGNYAVARLTVPAGGDGTYQLVTTARPVFDSGQLDTDFHVTRNNVEIFGVQLDGAQTAGYTNTLALTAGDTIDFAVGRGADNSHLGSLLKLEAALTRQTNTAGGLTLVVPRAAETNDSVWGGGVFVDANFRHQQVYGSNEFPIGAILIRELRFRPDRVHGSAFSTTISNIQVNLSTTQRNPSALSSTYAQNVGSNDTVVFQGALPLSSQFQGPVNESKALDMVVPLSQPFLYDPAGGHLVIDVRNFSGSSASRVGGHTGPDNAWRVLGSLASATGAVDAGVDAIQVVYSLATSQAPAITAHPTNRTVVEGSSVTFSVTATGSAPLMYQWRRDATAISGATNSTLILTNVQLSQAGDYSAVVSNAFGVVTSEVATLTVNPAPTVIDYDLSRDFSLAAGNPNGVWSYGWQGTLGGPFNLFTFSKIAQDPAGTPVEVWEKPLSVPSVQHNNSTNTVIVDGGQGNFPPETTWFFPGVEGQPENFGVIRFTVPVAVGGTYDLVTRVLPAYSALLQLDTDFHVLKNGVELFGRALNVSDTAGYTNSLVLAGGDTVDFVIGRGADNSYIWSGLKITATLDLTSTNTVPPTITAQPENQTVLEGSNVTFSVTATGSVPLMYQWRSDGSAIPNATNSTLLLTNVQLGQSGNYSVVVSNAFGVATSQTATLTVTGAPPAIVTQPANQTAMEGDSVTFSVSATGSALLRYQWRKEATAIDGATNSTLILTNVQLSQAGNYSMVVSNDFGVATSQIAILTVVPDTNCVPVRQGLVSWWRAEDNAQDSRGTNHGTVMGGGFASGARGQAFSFDGDDRVAVPDSQSLQITPSLSIEGWINIRAWPSPQNFAGAGMVVYRGDDRPGLDPFYVVVLNTGILQFAINSADNQFAGVNAPVVTNRFIHFAATLDDASGAMKLYLDGTLAAETTTTLRPAGNVEPPLGLGIGNSQAGSTIPFGFNGLVDELKLYSRALTPVEVRMLYTNAPCQVNPFALVVPKSAETNDTTYGGGTFTAANFRHQQVYGSNEFPSGAISIRELRFRPDRAVGSAFSTTVSNIQINLSTTQRNPSSLSSTYALNVGSNDTVVFQGALPLSSQFQGPTSGPKAFDMIVPLSQPFLYDPAGGHLVIDVRNFSGSSAASPVSGQTGPDNAWRVLGSLASATGAVDTGADTIQIIYFLATNQPPAITSHPTNRTVVEGSSVTFSVTATGSAPLRYQWRRDASAIADAINSTLILTNVQLNQAGAYSVIVSNAFGMAISQTATLTVNPAPPLADHDLSRDFSLAGNPNGVWSYGRQDTIGGAFTLLGTAKTNFANVPIILWAISGDSQPAIQHNDSTGTAVTDGGQGVYPPETTWFGPGPLGQPGNYAVARFTVPAGGDGTYQLLTSARPGYSASLQLDTDFHVARNNLEIFGVQLNGSQTADYTNTLALAAGDTIDFAVGRGADNSYIWSQLKVEAILDRVSSNGVPPTIVSHPTNQAVVEGSSATFSVSASGSAPLKHQWRRDATAIPDATNSTLILTNVQLSQAGSYSVVVSNVFGMATSQTAMLTVLGAPPSIVTHPTNQTVVEGSSATFSVGVSGSAPLRYQWRRAGTNIPNATNSTLILTNVQLSQEGSYSVTMSNLFGRATSELAILTVSPAGRDTNCVPVRQGLVSWWRAEGNAQDSRGTNHGTVMGAGFVSGARGQAFSFDGDDRVAVVDSQSLQITPSLSIEGWINIRNWPRNNSFGAGMVVYKGDDRGGLDPFYVAVLDTGVLQFAINSVDNQFAGVSAPVGTNRFIHFAGTLDDASGAMRLYLDGTLAAETTTTVRPAGDVGPPVGLGIGNAQAGSGFSFGFNGLVDELKLYSRALTLTEVRMLYTNAPCPEAEFDLSRDFSLAGNPNGAWSYGRQNAIGGAFTLLGTAKTNFANVPVLLWAINASSQPAILHNDTTETAITDGGQGAYPPETTWFAPGVQGQPGNYAVARLTVPAGGDGTYQLVTRARPGYNVALQRDTDFHVARNNVEIFGVRLDEAQTAGYTNTLALAAGDTIDFAVGRGEDNSHIWSQLKVEATLTKHFSNLQPIITNVSGGGRTFALTFNGLLGSYTIEASTNLINWVTLTNIVGAAGQVQVSDPAVNSLPQRFYRARFSP